MELIVNDEHLGPSAKDWDARISKLDIARLGPLHARRLVVVAPHPDDEVLGAGGLIQQALQEHVLVEVVSVTDGESSHPKSVAATRFDLAKVRHRELRVALRRLGCDESVVMTLRLPDGGVAQRHQQLDDALESILLPDDLCVAPWRYDGHPDHNACGESARRASRQVGARSLGYLVWAWHWADPDGTDIPWDRCVRLELTRRACARKRWSTSAFRSQILPIGPSEADAPILPAPLLRRFWRPYELFVDEQAGE